MKIKSITFIQFFILYVTLFPLVFGATDGAVKSYAILTLSILTMLTLYMMKFYKQISKDIIINILKFMLIGFLIILLPTIIFSPNWIINDFFELYRPVLYSLVFLLPLTIKWDYKQLKSIYKVFIFIVIINIVFAIIQPLGIVDFLSFYYAIPQNYFFMHRASGTFPAPYDLGYIFVLVYLYFLLYFILYKKLINLLFIIFILFTVILTQSRTALLLIVISSLALFFFSFLLLKVEKTKLLSKNIILTFILFLVLIVSIIIFNYDLLYERYSYLIGGLELFLSGQDNATLATRFSQSRYILQGVDNNILTILFGNGINKDIARYLESFYIMYQYRFGAIGLLFAISLYFILPIYFSFKAFKNTFSLDKQVNILFLSLFIWFLITPIACVGNSFVDIPRINFIFFFMYGLSYYFSKRSNVERFSINNNTII